MPAPPSVDIISTLVSFTLGGAGAKALDFLMNRGRAKFDLDAARRAELRQDLDRSRAHSSDQEKEIEELRKECDSLRDQNFVLKSSAHTAAIQLADLHERVATLSSRIEEFQRGVTASDGDG